MVTASMAGLMMPVSAMAVISGLRASGNTAGIMGMAAHVRASGNTAGIMGMAAHVRASGNAAGVMGMAAHVRASGNAAGVMGMAAHVCASRNAAGVMGMAAHVCTPRNAAGVMGMIARVRAACYTAVMIPVTVVSRVGVAVLAVMHVSGGFGTARNTACAVAVFPGQGTAVDAAKSVCMRGFQSAACYTAVMIPMPVIRRVGVAVLAVMHVGGCFGTARNTACAVAVFPGQSTAVDAARAVLVYFRLCTTCHFAGNTCSIFLCRPLDFRGTLIYRIGDNTACHHGNGYKRNG